MGRIALRIAPLIAAAAGVFGAYYIVVAGLALARGNVPFAVFYAVYGLGGVVLAIALWRVWRGSHAGRAGTRSG